MTIKDKITEFQNALILALGDDLTRDQATALAKSLRELGNALEETLGKERRHEPQDH